MDSKTTRTRPRRLRRQSGAAAVEFAFVFPVLLLLVYGTVVYGYIFFLQQTLNLVIQESAKVAVAVATSNPTTGAVITPDYNSAVSAYFTTAKAQGTLSSLPAAVVADFATPVVTGPTTITSGGTTVGDSITVTGQVLNVRTIFPQLTIPGIGASLPPLPATLSAQATVRVS